MSEAVIVLDNVSKSYPMYHHITGGIKNFLFHLPMALSSMKNSRFEVLRNISFEVYKGETLGIIGRNGAGKSTTLGLIAGVLSPLEGRIIVKGRVSPLLELGAGFHPELTGRENIILNGVILGLTRRYVLRKMDEIIDFSELGEFIDQPIRTYSSGMLARLGFSVVSSLDPEILLIDEVLAVGDESFQKKSKETLLKLINSGVTTVFVSHNLNAIKEVCHRAIWLDHGKVRAEGNPGKVVKQYITLI